MYTSVDNPAHLIKGYRYPDWRKRMMKKKLKFKVSTGLKTVLGSELITDDEVAIFELVKNSFDANASRVSLHFSHNSIVIADNGDGMSLNDINDKWLMVAYSSKRGRNTRDFREAISERRHYAGSKGIGRFSCDRLGSKAVLQTRAKNERKGPVHQITVNWDLFDRDPTKLFQSVGLDYEDLKQFNIPKEILTQSHGTVITVKDTRTDWTASKIRDLKSALSKLINPFGSSTDNFKIHIIAPEIVEEDNETIKRYNTSGEPPPPNAVANGEVGNFIFETLEGKTTYLSVSIVEKGEKVESHLVDRGELIYRIREPNPFQLLNESKLECQIYFLNTSAKQTFARRMGVPSVQFGSVFLFRNGFRIYPVGEELDDWFGMDRRKQQGYARFLGTRDVIGKIEVAAEGEEFQEASSRNQGLIESEAVRELRRFFMEMCLQRLERYVVPVTFVDKEDRHTSDISRLLTDPGRARVAAVVAKLVDNDNVELLGYSQKIIQLLNDRSEQFEPSLASFRAIAERTRDKTLFARIEQAEARFTELKRSEAIARRQADRERAAKEAAQERAAKAEQVAAQTGVRLEEERKRNLFLTSIADLDLDNIINLHHQVTIYAVSIQQQIENFLVEYRGKNTVPIQNVVEMLDGLSLLNRRIMGVAKFATKANFRMESEKIRADLSTYIEQYVLGVASDFTLNRMSLEVTNDKKGFEQSFKPIDISVVIENLLSNSRKARATKVKFEITHPSRSTMHIYIRDNGRGLDPSLLEPSEIFEKGVTSTDGSGLGLYHVQQVLGEMNGTIEVVPQEESGLSLLIRISK